MRDTVGRAHDRPPPTVVHPHPANRFHAPSHVDVADITLTIRHMEAHMGRSREAPEHQPGVNLSSLYRLSATSREAAGLLWKSFDDPQVDSFLNDLSPGGRQHLAAVEESLEP